MDILNEADERVIFEQGSDYGDSDEEEEEFVSKKEVGNFSSLPLDLLHEVLTTVTIEPVTVEKNPLAHQNHSSENNGTLYCAFENLDFPLAKKLIKRGVGINYLAIDKSTPLHIAIFQEAPISLIRRLIDSGQSPNVKKEDGATPLHVAISIDAPIEVISLLIEKGANVNARQKNLATPLMLAAWNGVSPKVCKLLLDAGADVNLAFEDGTTPLYWAARMNCVASVLMLLKAGAKVDAAHKIINSTALFVSIETNSIIQIIEALVNAGANVNVELSDGFTPLLVACTNDSPLEVIELLVEAGADVNHANKAGLTPMYALCQHPSRFGHLQAVLKGGAEVNSCYFGYSPLFSALENGASVEYTEYLINAGADVNFVDMNGVPILNVCIEHNLRPEVTEVILNAGADADINRPRKDGLTPIMVAGYLGVSEVMVNLLLRKGADITAKCRGKNALDFATGAGQTHLLPILKQALLEKDPELAQAEKELELEKLLKKKKRQMKKNKSVDIGDLISLAYNKSGVIIIRFLMSSLLLWIAGLFLRAVFDLSTF